MTTFPMEINYSIWIRRIRNTSSGKNATKRPRPGDRREGGEGGCGLLWLLLLGGTLPLPLPTGPLGQTHTLGRVGRLLKVLLRGVVAVPEKRLS